MRSRWIPVVCWIALSATFVLDIVTPQTLVVAILLGVPIVFSAFVDSRRLTGALVVAALIADVVAGYVNGAHDGYHWDLIGVIDRALSALSIALVGYLSTAVQERALRVGRLAAQESRTRREVALSTAIDRIRASLSADLVTRAVVREAPGVLHAVAARWYHPDRRDGTLLARAGDEDVVDVPGAATPEIVTLVRRALDAGEPLAVHHDDPVGGFALDAVQASAGLAIPLADRGGAFGVVLALFDAPPDAPTASVAAAYGRAATSALAQAALFAQLAERNDALAERTAVIRDLVYALSHDLRTPLAALNMTLRQAREGAYGALPPSYDAILERSVVATDDLQRLADTLLLVARFEAGERRPERERVELTALARQVTGEMEAIAHVRHVGLQLQASAAELATTGDRTDLRRALANLVANALEHTPEGGQVRVVVRAGAGTAELVVEDDGYGVGESARASLFQRFARGDRRAAGSGSGLGLYIVRRIAEETGGTVRYAPRQPRGSAFTLALPVNA